jgi:riboflavin kinase / FMN adenylyltransferase
VDAQAARDIGFATVRITRLPDAQRRDRRVAVGSFDGVHLGHREVIRGSDSVLTFDPHPSAVVAPQHTPKLLTQLDVKAELVEALGVQEMIVIPFDADFAKRGPEEFIEDVLLGALGATYVSVGENFRFGNRAKGDPQMLAEDDRFSTRVVPLLEVGGEIVSSSHIRGLVLAGEVEQAAGFLGAPFQMRGEVVSGDQRGRELGFPTANLIPNDSLVCPGHGVYACLAEPLTPHDRGQAGTPSGAHPEGHTQRAHPPSRGAGGKQAGAMAAAVNVGVRPTFLTGRGELVEAYILDFEGDLYGRPLRLDFLSRLRGERRFSSAEELVEQMHRDVERTREIVAQHAP